MPFYTMCNIYFSRVPRMYLWSIRSKYCTDHLLFNLHYALNKCHFAHETLSLVNSTRVSKALVSERRCSSLSKSSTHSNLLMCVAEKAGSLLPRRLTSMCISINFVKTFFWNSERKKKHAHLLELHDFWGKNIQCNLGSLKYQEWALWQALKPDWMTFAHLLEQLAFQDRKSVV